MNEKNKNMNEKNVKEEKKLKQEGKEKDVGKQMGDVDVFFPVPEFINTINGERIIIPLMNLKKEFEIGHAITRIIKKIPNLQGLNLRALQPETITKMLPVLMETAPEELTFMASTILGKDQEWIGDNLDLDILMDLLIPFFLRVLRKLASKITKFENQLDSLKL